MIGPTPFIRRPVDAMTKQLGRAKMSAPTPLLKQPHWFTPPLEVWLPYQYIEAGPLGAEAAIEIRLGESTASAFVPVAAIDERRSRVRCQVVGQIGQDLFVAFPPTSLGGTTARFNSSDLADFVSPFELSQR